MNSKAVGWNKVMGDANLLFVTWYQILLPGGLGVQPDQSTLV